MRTRIFSVTALISASIFLSPLAAQAIFYAPGETLNPACGPTDPTCGVTTPFTLFQNGNVGIGTANPTAKLDITGINSTAVIGPELIIATADRDFSSDTGKWTGTNWTIDSGVDTHTAGATALTLDSTALSSAPVSGNEYQIVFTTNTTVAGTIIPNIGGVNGIAVGQATAANTQTQIITATGIGALTFTPDANWTGTIDNVSVKQITLADATQIVRKSDGTIGLEIRTGGGFGNIFTGQFTGQSITTGTNNTGYGYKNLRYNTTGSNNTAAGTFAFTQNTTGNGNIAFGAGALLSNTTANNNTAVGTNALNLNTIGGNNTATGFNALQFNKTGTSNTATGLNALVNNSTGNSNTATGNGALLSNTTGGNNTANGSGALGSNTTGTANVANGINAMSLNTTGSNNTANGPNALSGNTTGSNNVAEGINALGGNTTGSTNTALGRSSGVGVTTGSSNTLIGVSISNASLNQVTTGSNNISIGTDVAVASSTLSNQLDIGNLIYGTGLSGIGLTVSPGFIGIGTSSPQGRLDVSGSSALTTLNTFDGNRAFSIINTNTTNNNSSGVDFRTNDTNGLLTTGAKVMGVYTSHAANAVSGDLAFLTRNAGTITENMRITGAGAVGIGTSSPAQKLEVVGTIRQSGCITAGTLSANTAGDIICTPSSLRFKDNIQSVAAGLSEIVQLRPVSYHFKPELDMGSSTRFGLIAEEVASVTPEFATYDAKGAPYGLDTNAILAATVNAIKELDVRVNGGVSTIPSTLQSLANSIGQTASALTSDAFTQIASWLGDAGNGIARIFAKEVNTETLCVSDSSGAKTCIDKGKLDALIAGAPTPPPTPGSVTTAPLEPLATSTSATLESTTTPESTPTPLLPNTGVLDSPPPPLFERTLDIGSSGPDVTALQILLMQKGFLFMPSTLTLGYFGEITRTAVMQYQASVGLAPLGTVGPATRAKLNSELTK